MLNRILLLCGLFILSFILTIACCEDNAMIVGSGEMNAFMLQSSELIEIDTVHQEFVLTNFYDMEYSGIDDWGMSSALATECKIMFVNSLDPSSLSLSLNEALSYDNTTLEIGDNLLRLDEFVTAVTILRQGVQINISNEFLSNSDFNVQDYTFTIRGVTSDGVELSNSKTLFVNL